ncbi:MAG: hypothetical protein HN576_14900 [Bacteriovoracaceae bacterium]|jgi:hypothetical protein|nr:hypothetical protein [Bacteriovoracaceae bacterium]
MKKIIFANLFVILLTGLFLYGKNYSIRNSQSLVFEKYGLNAVQDNLESLARQNIELTAKLENYILDHTSTLIYKRENKKLASQIIKLEKHNYKLLTYIGSLKSQMQLLEHSSKHNKNLAMKEYEKIKYKKKIVHADILNKKLKKYMRPDFDLNSRAPASAPANNGVESKEYKIHTTKKHVIDLGEDLMKISKIHYNTHSKWNIIVKANPEIDMNKLEVGQVLVIPNIADEAVVWIDGKMILSKDAPSERKPATISKPQYE